MAGSRRLRQAAAAVRLVAGAPLVRAGAAPSPRAVHLHLLHRCEPRCRDCRCDPDRWPELDTAGWLAVLDHLGRPDFLKILGGDPLLRRDLPRLVERSLDRALVAVQVNTWGHHREALLELLRRAGRPGLHVRVGLHGGPESHDRAVGLPGAWARASGALRAAAPLARRRGVRLGINLHVTDANLHELPRVAALARSLGVGFHPGIPVRAATWPERPGPPRDLALPLTDLAAYAAALERAPPPAYPWWLAGWMRRVDRRTARRHLAEGGRLRFPCLELRALAQVRPDGRLVACALRPDPLGSLVEHDVRALWRTPAVRAARTAVATCPGCHLASVQALSRLYAGRLAWGPRRPPPGRPVRAARSPRPPPPGARGRR